MIAACQSIASPHITFSTDIPDEIVWDIALISGALQYIPNAYKVLGNAARVAKWLILTRLPIHDGSEDRFMMQTVPAHIHEGSMPIEIFSATKIKAAILEIGTIELSWSVSLDDGAFAAIPARSVGYLINTRAL
jgi:putative methyltransferase (TIGR04325 family)